jgi:hypothetical protein
VICFAISAPHAALDRQRRGSRIRARRAAYRFVPASMPPCALQSARPPHHVTVVEAAAIKVVV